MHISKTDNPGFSEPGYSDRVDGNFLEGRFRDRGTVKQHSGE